MDTEPRQSPFVETNGRIDDVCTLKITRVRKTIWFSSTIIMSHGEDVNGITRNGKEQA